MLYNIILTLSEIVRIEYKSFNENEVQAKRKH